MWVKSIDYIFPVKTGILVSRIHPEILSDILLCRVKSEKLYLVVARHMLLKNIHIHSLNVLNCVYIVVFDVETAIDNAKLAILGRLELQISFTPSPAMVRGRLRYSVFYKN